MKNLQIVKKPESQVDDDEEARKVSGAEPMLQFMMTQLVDITEAAKKRSEESAWTHGCVILFPLAYQEDRHLGCPACNRAIRE